MITPLFVLFSKTILTQEVTMDFYFLINCSTSLYNRPSIAYCEKLGFKFEGEFKKHLYLKGKFENLKWYALLKEQYKCLKQNY